MDCVEAVLNAPDWCSVGRHQRVAVRSGSLADVDAIAAVHLEAALVGFTGIFPPTVPIPTAATLRPRWWELMTDGGVDVFVAVATDVVGCAVVRPADDVPAGMLLDRLYVHPLWWGKGIGRRLHDAALAAAHNHRVGVMNLWVLEANTKARSMYERWGWRLVPGRTRPNEPPTVLDVLYTRALMEPHRAPDPVR